MRFKVFNFGELHAIVPFALIATVRDLAPILDQQSSVILPQPTVTGVGEAVRNAETGALNGFLRPSAILT